MSDSRIEAALVKAGLVDEMQLRSARHHQAQWGGTIMRAIVEKGFAREGAVVDAIATAFGVTRADLGLVRKDPLALAKIPVEVAEKKGVFPVALRDNGKTLYVAMPDPTDLDLTDSLLRVTRCRIKAQVAGDKEIAEAIRVHYRGEAPHVSSVVTVSAISKAIGRGADFGPMLETDDLDGEPSLVPPPEPEPDFSTSQPMTMSPRASADPLDDLFGTAPESEFSPADIARLERIRANQEKGSRILDAVIDLCLEKGLLSREEQRDRLRRN
jgi:hypothetical protein